MTTVQDPTAIPVANNTGKTIPVEEPATGRTISTIPVLGAQELARMGHRARTAQPEWQAMGFEGRAEVLLRAQAWIVDNHERVVATLSSETGKPNEDATMEFSYAASALGFWAKHAPRYLADERLSSLGFPLLLGKKLVSRYVPIGVAGVIGPWNWPIANSFGDGIPALAAGCSLMLKPSEITPLSSLLMEEMMRESGLPEGVFQVATGDGTTGAALLDVVDCVVFTGSVATGRKVGMAAAERLIPCHLELGGKDPMIVCADADIERAASGAAFYAMANAGQVCSSVERVYVEAPVYDEFVQRVTDNVRDLRQGPTGDPGTVDVGTMIFPPQRDIVDGHVRDAVAKGAKVLTGGRAAPGPGRFYEPTVLVDVDHSMKVMTEETFGPVLPVMKVGTIADAVKLANDSPYGLQASVWTSDVERGEELARQIEAGVACVNYAIMNAAALNLPMGGWKASGVGAPRHGAEGIRKFTHQQSLLISGWTPVKRELFMFPYRRRKSKVLQRLVKLLYGRLGRLLP